MRKICNAEHKNLRIRRGYLAESIDFCQIARYGESLAQNDIVPATWMAPLVVHLRVIPWRIINDITLLSDLMGSLDLIKDLVVA